MSDTHLFERTQMEPTDGVYLHWLAEELCLINRVSSFEEMADVCLAHIRRVAPREGFCLVSGPISTGGLGCSIKNGKMFSLTIEKLYQNGHFMFDQRPLQNSFERLMVSHKISNGNGYCMPILEVVYEAILSSGQISMLAQMPSWDSSFGACWEDKRARELGIRVWPIPRKLLPLQFRLPKVITRRMSS